LPVYLLLAVVVLSIAVLVYPPIRRARLRRTLAAQPFPAEWNQLLQSRWLLHRHLPREVRERAEYEAKLQARAEREKKAGRKPGGRPPAPPSGAVDAKEQINLTDEDSRIMPVAGGAGLGTADGALETEEYVVIWVDVDGCESAQQYCSTFLTTVVKNMPMAVEGAVLEAYEADDAVAAVAEETVNVGVEARDGRPPVDRRTVGVLILRPVAIDGPELRFFGDAFAGAW
jgi:hypothetical protein